MLKTFKILLVSICLCSLIGCMTPQMDLAYQTKPTFNVKPIKTTKTVSSPVVKDLRGTNPNFLGSSTGTVYIGQYGIKETVTTNYIAKKPLAYTIAKGINEALTMKGFKIAAINPDYDLKINLLNIKTWNKEGFIHSVFYCRLTALVELKNAKTNQLIWKRTLVANSSQHMKIFVVFKDAYKFQRMGFHKALNYLIEQMLNAKGFRAAFN